MSKQFSIVPPTEQAWINKAKALDRFRWQQLRQRHTWFGATLRTIRERIFDSVFGLFAHYKQSPSQATKGCDFLLFQGSAKVILLKRKKDLIALIQKNGHHLVEVAHETPQVIIQKKMVTKPPYAVPLRYYGYAAYAEWITAHYNPSLVINDRNGSLVSPFLRLSLNRRSHLLVHLAHASTLEQSRRLDMTDYDYYFLFGQSSLDALKARTLRFGNTQAVLAGSHMIDQAFDLPPANVTQKTILVLGVGPDKEKKEDYQRTYALINTWASQNPEFKVLIKAHPRSRVPFWQQSALTCKNIEILANNCALAEALSQTSIVINVMSNAVIEAALAQRPIIYVNTTAEIDIFDQKSYFGEQVNSIESLSMQVEWIQSNYQLSIENTKKFTEHHLSHSIYGLKNTYKLIVDLKNMNKITCQCLNSTQH
ncbi:MAG: capsule biosynthesis protein [Desulfobacteraceae bacterium 4572_35.1]|nr:MAG: capsule biosynthesis protein [Desulfobacteraceae bacterium 4572_35.1]